MSSKTSKANIKNVFIFIVLIVIGVAISWYVVNYPKDSIVSRFITYDRIINLLLQHIYIVFLSSILAIATSVPLGIILTRPRFKKLNSPVMGIVNIGQTVPSLAIIALFVSVLGIGVKTAIFALWIYSLLPILNNTIAGIQSVDTSIIEAAKGIGMKPIKILTKVELPLVLPIIIAGIKTAVVINIGNAVLATFVGAGGLGDLIIAGNNINRWQILMLGTSLPVLMAFAVDYLLTIFENSLKKA
ncbi:ABC-type proline/glycine betaine transport system, permease component [Gottschalkia purinilytica]|uniref:ABC-type proline/glycine betaine transport system, permease component n=1 Tax=Gottschalkia purinilytica TaxID=1503 RepID=A0A0L0W6H3_GOTPU|nr:ABC transporter permease [Gottschalkia purinilytica]KNF07082.1 ABC-type proline/glycine betaine transport system, permease component [Gottschalkia purinilytica]